MAATVREASPPSPRKQHSLTVNSLRPSRALLAEWTLARFLARRPPSHVVTLEADMTVGGALAALNRHSILSAPVINQENGDVVGILSVRDVLSAFLAGVYPGLLRGSTPSAASRADELAAAGAEFCERKVRALGYGGDGKLLYKARASATLYDLVSKGFISGTPAARPHHRVAIWDLDGKDARGDDAMRVTAVVSQTDIVRFLHRHATDLGDLAALSLEALLLDRKPVVTLPASTSALQAFAEMSAAGVSAVGITSAVDGPLVANISASDLRCLTTTAGWGMLALPVSEFLLQKNGEAATATELREAGGVLVGRISPESRDAARVEAIISAIVPLHFVRPSTTFSEALAMFDVRGVHHLWVLCDDHRPVGVITPTDLLKLIVYGAPSAV